MFWWILIAAQIIPLLVWVYIHFDRKNNYWKERGVKGPKPLPIFGNTLQMNQKGFNIEKEWSAKYGKVYGMFMVLDPILTIIDHELIKQVLVKDFHIFVNRDKNPVKHEIWDSNLFSSEDEQWKRIRAITSPSFTTGKLRSMQKMMNTCVNSLCKYFDKTISGDSKGQMNMKEVITGFTIDVIGATSFALETNANLAYDCKNNTFLDNGTKMFDFTVWRFISLFLLPNAFNRAIGNSIGFSDKRFNFFRDLSQEILRKRKENATGKSLKRPDLVQLMMDAFVYEDDLKSASYDTLIASDVHEDEITIDKSSAENEQFYKVKKTLTENEIIAQCILFFAAGFETTASTISTLLYNLSIHSEIQQRLYDELTNSLDGIKEDSKEYYDIIMNHSPYMEAVIKETLRMTPPVTRLQRRVGVDSYKLNGIPLERDTKVNIGTLAVHYCADYYPDPERFDPERFMPENKHLLVPYTYLPFGAGPRNCVGMRFAYQEIRFCLAKVVRQYRFEATPETKIPLEFVKIGIMTSKNIPLRVVKRV